MEQRIIATHVLRNPVSGGPTYYAAMDDGRVWSTVTLDDGAVAWRLQAPPLPAEAWRPHQAEG